MTRSRICRLLGFPLLLPAPFLLEAGPKGHIVPGPGCLQTPNTESYTVNWKLHSLQQD